MEGFENSTLEHLDDTYKVHVRAVFDLTQKAMPYLLKTKGIGTVKFDRTVKVLSFLFLLNGEI